MNFVVEYRSGAIKNDNMMWVCVEYSIVSNPRLALLFQKLVLSNHSRGFSQHEIMHNLSFSTDSIKGGLLDFSS